MGKVTHIVRHKVLDWAMTVEIDTDHTFLKGDQEFSTIAAIIEMVQLRSGWKHALLVNKGNYVMCFLQMLAEQVLSDCMDINNPSIKWLINKFNNRKGWYNMDGSTGIKILQVDTFQISLFEFTIDEQKELLEESCISNPVG